MLNQNNLLINALSKIENGLKNGVNADNLAAQYKFSTGHLRRLFKCYFKHTLSEYIRSRKLSASIYDLINTDKKIIDIALAYDFEYEQSYIRSFKREFGITPGELRKSGKMMKNNQLVL